MSIDRENITLIYSEHSKIVHSLNIILTKDINNMVKIIKNVKYFHRKVVINFKCQDFFANNLV